MEILVGILMAAAGGLMAAVLLGLTKRQLHSRGGGRQEVEVRLFFNKELAALPVEPRVLVVREGPDSAELLNRGYSFTKRDGFYTVKLDYPLRYGLQFKCFLDWTSSEMAPPSLAEMRAICEKNGWTNIGVDGLHPGRFWFILPEFATKQTEDNEAYLNNWFPAGPRPS